MARCFEGAFKIVRSARPSALEQLAQPQHATDQKRGLLVPRCKGGLRCRLALLACKKLPMDVGFFDRFDQQHQPRGRFVHVSRGNE